MATGWRGLRPAARGQFQQGLSGLTRQVVGQGQQGVFVGLAHIVQPLGRHAVAQERLLGDMLEQARFGWGRLCSLHVGGDDDFLDRLANLHQLRRAGLRVRFQLPALGPAVGLVMVIDVAQQQACGSPVHDQPDIAADPHRPEVRVFRFVEFVQLHAGLRRVQLQVEGGDFDRFLLLAGEPRQAIRERVGDGRTFQCGEGWHSNEKTVRFWIPSPRVPKETDARCYAYTTPYTTMIPLCNVY